MVRDTLYNASLSVTDTELEMNNCNAAQIYGRGVIVGVVGAIMGYLHLSFKEALVEIKRLGPSNLDMKCLPECWVEDYLQLPD